MVLEIVRGFFDIPPEEMVKIGDLIKNLLFNPVTGSEEEAMSNLKEALEGLPTEQVLLAGMFVSGLLRCNLSSRLSSNTHGPRLKAMFRAVMHFGNDRTDAGDLGMLAQKSG